MTRHSVARIVLITTSLAWASAPAFAQSQEKSGGAVFLLYCASCHGPQARGDGPVASAMQTKPADLTRIAARNGGKFPEETVSRMIDGRNPVKGHGGQGMPVWGDAFRRVEGDQSPSAARTRIESVVKYLASIQQK